MHGFDYDFKPEEDLKPVTDALLLDAMKFANYKSELEGFESAYKIDGNSIKNLNNNGLRLPNQSELQFASDNDLLADWNGFGEWQNQEVTEYVTEMESEDRSSFRLARTLQQ